MAGSRGVVRVDPAADLSTSLISPISSALVTRTVSTLPFWISARNSEYFTGLVAGVRFAAAYMIKTATMKEMTKGTHGALFCASAIWPPAHESASGLPCAREPGDLTEENGLGL